MALKGFEASDIGDILQPLQKGFSSWAEARYSSDGNTGGGGGGSTGPAPVPRIRTNRASIGGGVGSTTLIIIALLLVGGFVFSSYIKS